MENARLSIATRVPLVDPINVLQANVLLRMRHDENQVSFDTIIGLF
jgi:phosphoenolpyruvate carboxylase